jgi:hypothetical protein
MTTLLPLRVVSFGMIALGLSVLAAIAIPATTVHVPNKVAVAIAALNVLLSGIGLFYMKRWAVYLFFAVAGITTLANFVSFGHSGLGKSWVGIVVVGTLAILYWRQLK